MRLRRQEDQARMTDPRHSEVPVEDAADRNRMSALERTVLLADHLAREQAAAGVWDALARHAPAVVGGWAAACFVPDHNGVLHLRTDDATWPDCDEGARRFEPSATVPAMDAAALAGAFTPALFTRSALRSAEPPLHALASIFEDDRIDRIACISVGGRGLLAVLERRATRSFEPDDWYRLRTIAVQADVTLERLELRQRLDEVAAGHGPHRDPRHGEFAVQPLVTADQASLRRLVIGSTRDSPAAASSPITTPAPASPSVRLSTMDNN